MPEIAYGALLPVPPERAFAFVTDPVNLPLFFDSMRSAEPGTGWGRPGGRARVVLRFMGRDVTSDWELTEWIAPHRFRYTGRQEGRADVDNLRVFEPVGTGTRLRGTTRITPRPGVAGLVDRVSLLVLKRVFDRAMARLPEAISSAPPV